MQGETCSLKNGGRRKTASSHATTLHHMLQIRDVYCMFRSAVVALMWLGSWTRDSRVVGSIPHRAWLTFEA